VNLRKGIIVCCSILLTVILLIACSDDNTNTVDDSNNNLENNEDGNNSKEDAEPITITMMSNLHTPEVPDDRIINILEEKTNVRLDIDWVPDSNYDEKLNTAFSTGSLPQVVSVSSQQLDQFREAIKDDQFWEIGPYLEDYENLSKLKDSIVENTMVNGKVYGLYQGRPLSREGMIYRKDWADNLGLSEPKTPDDVFEMARAFTEDDPDGNGEDDTIGITDFNNLTYGAFKTIASWFGTPNNWGEKDGKLLPEFMFPEYMDAMDYMKDLRDQGYINQDFPVTSKDEQGDMIKNGTAGIRFGTIGDVVSLYNDAVEINPDIEYDVHTHIEGPHGEYGIWSIPGYGKMYLFPKSATETEEDLQDILEFYDQMMTPEISNLIYWGVEGDHYTVEDGKAKTSNDQEKRDRETRAYSSLEIGEPDTNGRYDGFHDYETKVKAEELIKENEDYLIHDPTIALESEAFTIHGEKLKVIMEDATYNYILGEIDEAEFEQAIEDWKNQGGDDIIKEYNESWQELE